MLYPHPPAEHQLVLSYLPPGGKQGKLINFWLRVGELKRGQNVDDLIEDFIRDRLNVYFGVGLRRPDYPVNPETGMPPLSKRGKGEDVTLLPGLWIDIDHADGAHQTTNTLPTKAELLDFIKTLPFEPSLIVDTGGGLHVYLLFTRLWRLQKDQERYRAHCLLIRFQRTIQALMAKQGWHCDSTHDLSRVLRPAGSVNFKREAVPVTCSFYSGRRYRVERLERASWLLPLTVRQPVQDYPRFTGGLREGRPGEAFDKHCTPDLMLKMLEGHGWRVDHEEADVIYLTRPGKEAGVSGTLGHVGTNIFYCFSSNAQPLEGLEAYGPFRLYAVLQHQGNFSKAAETLSEKGWGTPRKDYETLEYIPQKGGAR